MEKQKFEFKIVGNDKTAILQFKEMQKLEFKVNRNGWIDFGKDNLYPNELIRLYDEHPEHRAIINRKARYVWGKGIKAKNPQDGQKVKAFIDGFNKYETLNELGEKLTANTELFNGCYIQVITDLKGVPIYFYLLKNSNCRISEDGNKLYYCKKWKKNTHYEDTTIIEKFKPNGKPGTYFIEWKYEVPTSDNISDIYPIENYRSAVREINTDIDISTFNEKYVNNNFSVGTIISFFNGVPSETATASIDRAFKGTYSGERGENILITHSDADGKAPVVTTIGVEELSEKFKLTSQRALQKIYAAHEIPPELFNKKFDDSFFASSTDLITLEQLHVNGYIEPRQRKLVDFLSYLSYLKTGEYLEMVIEPIGFIGIDIQNNANFTVDEKRAALGYAPKNPTPVGEDGKPLPVQANQYNELLTGLTATERNDINRIINKFKSGKTSSPDLAIADLVHYGYSEEQAKKFLGIEVKMSSEIDSILMALELSAQDDNNDEVILVEAAHIHNSKDALKYERQIMKFADSLIITVEQLDSAVLNALKGNPTLTIDDLAYSLKYDPFKVSESISRLIKKGLLVDNSIGFKPTEKGINKETEPIKNYEIYTVYKYALRDKAPKLSKGGSRRPFCRKLMNLSNNGKHWTFETIDNMTNDLGTNVWDYRGGYYNNPVTKETEPDCRHVWNAITKRRLKK